MKLNVKRTITVGFAFLAISMFWEIYNSLMPLMLANFSEFRNSNALAGLVISLGNVLGIILLPLMGKISDNSRTKFGRRMPFIVVGLIVGSIFLLLLNFAHEQQVLWLLLMSSGLLLIFMWSCRSPAVALMPDVTPKPVRSKANAIINLMGGVGGIIATGVSMVFKKTEELVLNDKETVLVLKLGTHNWLLIGAISLLMIVAVVILILNVKENELVKKKEEELTAANYNEDEGSLISSEGSAAPAKSFLGLGLDRPQLKSLGFLLLSIIFWFIAYTASRSWFSRFALEYLLIGSYEMPLMLAMLAGFAAFIPASALGSKIGRKKTVVLGIGIVAAGFLVAVLATLIIGRGEPVVVDNVTTYSNAGTLMIFMYICFLLVGAGWATINVHSFVMTVEMSNKKNVGTFTGIYYFASMTGQIIAPTVAGWIIDLFGGRPGDFVYVFPFSLLCMGLAFITMLFVKHGNVRKSVDNSAGNLSEKTQETNASE